MPCKYCQSPFSEQVVSQGQLLSQQEGGWERVVGGQSTLANSLQTSQLHWCTQLLVGKLHAVLQAAASLFLPSPPHEIPPGLLF